MSGIAIAPITVDRVTVPVTQVQLVSSIFEMSKDKMVDTELSQGEAEEIQLSWGDLSAPYAVCGTVFTLTKAGLVQNHVPVVNCWPASLTLSDASGDSATSPTNEGQICRCCQHRKKDTAEVM